MTRVVRFALVLAALVALSWVGTRAQGTTAGQKPPDAQAKPADVKPQASEDLPADFKTFNEVAKEKDAQKRVEAYEKFIADYPSSILVSMARSQMQSSLLAALKTAQTKYLAMAKAQIDASKTYSTYNRIASDMLSGDVLLDTAEEYAKTGLSLMDEAQYIQSRKQSAERAAEAFAKRAAAGPSAAPPPAQGVTGLSMSMVNGVMVARPIIRQPTPAPTTPPTPPRIPTDDELRTNFRSDKATALATFGQILLKRGKAVEGEQALKEAYAARPASYTLATVAKLLAARAKAAGDGKGQLEYLTTLALSGRITAEEQKDFEAVYRKTHSGSLDGLEEMLDARYVRDNPEFEVKRATRTPKPNDRAVLAELFSGAG